jgi:hypothetical protein
MKKVLLISLVLLSCVACSGRKNLSPMPSISDEERKALATPVNCQTAQRDLAILEEEKASVGRQVLAGVRSLMPIAAVAGILMGDYGDRVEVATGQYNRDLEAKIQDIKMTCAVR